VKPGLFRSRWDGAYADPDAELVVRAPGYEDWRAPAGPGEFEATLARPFAATATLDLEVSSKSAPLPGIWVSGRLNVNRRLEGRRNFIAMTGGEGRVDVAGLAQGPWIIRAEAGARGTARRDFILARGRNPLRLQLSGRRPLVSGVVVDDRKRPVAGARIERVVVKRNRANRDLPRGAFDRFPQLPALRTDRSGRFGLDLPRYRRGYLFRATAPGYETLRFEVVARPRKKPLVVTLPRLAAVALPLQWVDGRSRPIPDDIVMSISRRSPKNRRAWINTGITAHVAEGRLGATGLPAGQLQFSAVRGSAWAPLFLVTAKPGSVLEKPPVRLRTGGALEGEVIEGGQPVPGFLLYVGTRPARTDARGRFRVTGLPPRSYAIHADDQTEESRLKNVGVRTSDGFVGKVTVRINRGRGR
jgi:hypothetical protein